MYTRSSSIPSLPSIPLLGNVLALRNHRLQLLSRISQECGDIGAFHFGPRLVPVLNAPDLVREALVEQSAHFEKTAMVRRLAAPVLGNGIFLTEGALHRQQRRMLAPLFQHRQTLVYTDLIVQHVLRLCEDLQERETIDLGEAMIRLTVGFISEVLFGAELFAEERSLNADLTVLFRHFAAAITNPLRLPQSWPTPHNLRAQQALTRVNETLARLIERRRQQTETQSDILSGLVQVEDDGKPLLLNNQQLRDEALSLFVAGYETVGTALTWCWYLLSQHPEIYARLREEGDTVLAGRAPTNADLPNLPYTLQVFKEALRLYPPIYAFTRGAISDVHLGLYRIAKGTSVVISPYCLHRRADYFPNPKQFDPERFTPDRERQIPRYAFLPFGAGPHICLGMHLALLEGQLILATLAQRLTFEYVGTKTLEPEPLLTLRPKSAVLMKVRRR